MERYTDWMDNESDMGEQSGAPGSLSYSRGVQECELWCKMLWPGLKFLPPIDDGKRFLQNSEHKLKKEGA